MFPTRAATHQFACESIRSVTNLSGASLRHLVRESRLRFGSRMISSSPFSSFPTSRGLTFSYLLSEPCHGGAARSLPTTRDSMSFLRSKLSSPASFKIRALASRSPAEYAPTKPSPASCASQIATRSAPVRSRPRTRFAIAARSVASKDFARAACAANLRSATRSIPFFTTP